MKPMTYEHAIRVLRAALSVAQDWQRTTQAALDGMPPNAPGLISVHTYHVTRLERFGAEVADLSAAIALLSEVQSADPMSPPDDDLPSESMQPTP